MLTGLTLWVALGLSAALAGGIAMAARTMVRERWALRQARQAQQEADERAEQAQAALIRLREALDELPIGLEIYDSEDRLLLCNRRLIELYPWIRFDRHIGVRFEDILRESIGQGKVPAAVGREEEWLAQRLATRGTREGPMLQSLRSGHWINTYERRTASGFVVGVRLEVTDLVQKTRELEDSQARLQAIIGSAASGIISTDRQGVIIDLNDAAAQLFGQPAAQLVGQALPRLIQADGGNDLALRPLRDVEAQGIALGGRRVPLQLSVSEIQAAGGQQYVAIITDLTQRQQAEEARLKAERLEAENRQIQEGSRLKSQFLANMSHELRTPLNAIIGFADLLHAGAVQPDSPKQHVFVGHIASSGRHLLQIINDVLDLSKVESGKFEFFPEPLELRALVNEVTEILHPAIARKRIALAVEIDAQVSELVLDPARLKQVLYNYLSNAIKFTAKGGRVTVRGLAQGAAHVRLEVEDSGIGIAAQDLPRLFSEFQQLDAGYSKQHQGTGLGLALTRRLVEAQGGTVGVRSEPGRGSVFHAVLNRVHGADMEAAAGATGSAIDMPVHRLLVVEDDEPMRHQLTRGLASAGFTVDAAATAEQALSHARGQGFDALTLDLGLPDRSSLDLLARIRSEGPSRGSPVVAMTMAGDGGTVASFAIADILFKPIRSDEIVAAMARLPPPQGGGRVMVIDDDPLALELMRTTLAGIGIDAVCLDDGRRALREIDLHRPRAIVLDLMMPDFDGFAVLDALHRLPAWQDTPVFIWTSMLLTETEHSLLAQSARAILSKGGGGMATMLERLRHWRPGAIRAPERA